MKPRNAVGLVFVFFLGILLGGFALRQLYRAEGYAVQPPRPPGLRHTRFNLSQPTVVEQIQRLARLETVTYTMDKVVEGDKELRPLPNFLVGDKVVLVAVGHAIGGVDLSKLNSNDVAVKGKSVSVTLPPAQLLSVALDDSKTHVYSRQTGILVPADPNLESSVRAKAQKDLRQSALNDGILQTAHKNACSTVRSLLLGLGFQKVQCS